MRSFHHPTGYQIIHHSGSTFGYRAYLTLLPEINGGVVTLMTGSDYQYKFRTALHMHLIDHALGHDPWINSTTICLFPNPWKSRSSSRTRRSVDSPGLDEEVELASAEEEEEEEDEEEEQQLRQARAGRVARAASLPPSGYVGRYRHAAYGRLEVRYNRRTRSLELVYGVGRWSLEPTGGHHFDGLWLKDPPTINKSFRFKARGRSQAYAVEGIGFESSKPPVFYR